MLCVSYIAIVMPYRIAFEKPDTTLIKSIGYLIDGTFLIDLIMTFFTVEFDEED